MLKRLTACFTTSAPQQNTRGPKTTTGAATNNDKPSSAHPRSSSEVTMCMHNHTAGGAGSGNTGEREILPATVKPSHYKVEITPDLVSFEFAGVVDITLDVKEKIDKIVCNANELTFKSASVTSVHMKTENTQKATKINVDEKAETVTFEFATAIEAGATATLHVEYTGIHNDKMAGFYRSSYTADNGEKKHMVVSQFEATDCRRALPSWDEPNLKATFDVILNVEKNLTALSNMNQTEEKIVEINGKEKKAVHFATTPIMSTYLLAFAVGDLEYIEATATPKSPADAKPLVCRVYTLPGHKHKGHFALEVCARTLEFFSEYFDIAYPLPKMDLIAIPDFSAGAMENWGLVTYREILLLYDEKLTSAGTKQQITYVVGHELAHQWFGNLVTMDWWSELWLNEGFATFVGWMATDNLFPEWKVWTQFLVDDYASGKSLDALRSSHPIDVDVNSPAEISNIFDAISYCKGASVIRMLNAYLSTETFKKGIRDYLKKHQLSNATTGDLWAALHAASGRDVASFMHPWTRDVGYPLVHVVGESFDEAKGEVTLKLKQSRFLSSGDLSAAEDKEGTVWWIPLLITTHLSSRKPTEHILAEKEAVITFPYSKADGAFWKLNYDTTGFYRVRLNEEQLRHLGAVIKKTPDALTTEDKLGVLSDAFALALSGQGSTLGALELLKSFEAEDNYIVLKEVASRIDSVLAAWYKEPEEVVKGLKAIKRAIFAPKFKTLGLDYPAKEDHLTAMKRTLVIESAARAGDKDVIAALQERFKRFIGGDESALPPNIRGIAYEIVLYHSTQPAEDFESVLNIYKKAEAPDQRLYALRALGSTSDEKLVDRLLNEILLDTELVRSNEAYVPLRYLASNNPNPHTVRPKLWQFATTKWDAVLYPRYKPTISLLGHMFVACFVSQVGDGVAQIVEDWIAGKELKDEKAREKRVEEVKSIKRPVDQGLESVRDKSAWVKRDGQKVAAWVKESGVATA
ncbi:peptidase family M1-domain-containing protein [Fimicolochytrium jonesii]|uniref:peptidase family M1-domain-containing protein n=1 Tax=Fimicolochytrium jonesii TaxID=1396493 RepID=UPI0022FE39D0|nr:peptidase family M1-domain-containing protein [Fimicolochytrium jonesii]KAI8825989.1 peptidase family M1-domain-containing protein [Fimicolochytrium jonesii]